jgi:hypothetical protein
MPVEMCTEDAILEESMIEAASSIEGGQRTERIKGHG